MSFEYSFLGLTLICNCLMFNVWSNEARLCISYRRALVIIGAETCQLRVKNTVKLILVFLLLEDGGIGVY